MDYFTEGHSYADDIISVLQLFFPNSVYTRLDAPSENCVVSRLGDDGIYTCLILNGVRAAENRIAADSKTDIKRELKLSLYKTLMSRFPRELPWGALTGVRPAKLASSLIKTEGSRQAAADALKNIYFVRDDKVRLALEVSENEEKALEKCIPDSVGLYIGIPFCPTRCLYCSFTSYPLEKYRSRTDAYLDCLKREIELCGYNLRGVPIESVYIGGGTPTALDEKQLYRLLTYISGSFDINCEFTVEAGRPDTLTEEKLRIIKSFGIDRISINPQTLNDKTLRLIGRQHTSSDFFRAFETARRMNIGHINCDVILGLPGEGEDEVVHTFDGLKSLAPESLTVHTLAVKRASRLRETLEEYSLADFGLMDSLLALSRRYAGEMGLIPYYMYRQKNMVGNFENVSYCLPGHECIYNIRIMEENQTIIAMGCGGSTKIVDRNTDRIERIFNVKSVDDYIARTDEMLDRKIKGLNWRKETDSYAE